MYVYGQMAIAYILFFCYDDRESERILSLWYRGLKYISEEITYVEVSAFIRI